MFEHVSNTILPSGVFSRWFTMVESPKKHHRRKTSPSLLMWNSLPAETESNHNLTGLFHLQLARMGGTFFINKPQQTKNRQFPLLLAAAPEASKEQWSKHLAIAVALAQLVGVKPSLHNIIYGLGKPVDNMKANFKGPCAKKVTTIFQLWNKV